MNRPPETKDWVFINACDGLPLHPQLWWPIENWGLTRDEARAAVAEIARRNPGLLVGATAAPDLDESMVMQWDWSCGVLVDREFQPIKEWAEQAAQGGDAVSLKDVDPNYVPGEARALQRVIERFERSPYLKENAWARDTLDCRIIGWSLELLDLAQTFSVPALRVALSNLRWHLQRSGRYEHHPGWAKSCGRADQTEDVAADGGE